MARHHCEYGRADPWVTGAIMNEEDHQATLDWYAEQVEAGNLCRSCAGPPGAPNGDCDLPFHLSVPRQTGPVYDKMIHRETGGSDPLVQEPKE